ncbi:MAG: hypothetical protein KBF89_04415 [Acidimicrobiia bacterium]|nr:hypothetical protein [Acidimicrobiia bacterium]
MTTNKKTIIASRTKIIRVSVVAALVALAGIFFVISVSSSDTNTIAVSDVNVQKVDPTPGGLLRPTSEVSVNLADGFTGRLLIDGKAIPDDQVIVVKSLGQITYQPSAGKVFPFFEAGPHNAQVIYWKVDESENINPQTYTWDFRVTV